MDRPAPVAPMRARSVRWMSGIPIHPDPSHIKLAEQYKRYIDAYYREVRIPDSGHWVQNEAPAEVNAALLEFLTTEISFRARVEVIGATNV